MKKTVLVFLCFAVLSLSGCINQSKKVSVVTPTPTEAVKTLKEGEGPSVDLVARDDKKAVTLKISKLTSKISKIDYEIVYDTNGVQRGVLGSLDVKPQQTEIIKEILLASCSKNVCVYDKNVSSLQLTMRFTTDTVPLEYQKEYPL